MFLIVMLTDGSLVTIGTDGQWRPVVWDLTGGVNMPWAANVPINAVIMAEMLPPDTIDAYLADATTGLPVLEEQTA